MASGAFPKLPGTLPALVQATEGYSIPPGGLNRRTVDVEYLGIHLWGAVSVFLLY